MRGFLVTLLVGVFLAICVLWGWSLVAPARIGECTSVPARIGNKPFERDCRPYSGADFAAVLIAVGAFAWLILGSGELEWTFPWGGTLRIKREEGQKAAGLLRERADALEKDRGAEYLRGVELVIERSRAQGEEGS